MSRRTRLVRYVLAVLVLAVGVAGVVTGEADDSPGLQLLGGLVALGAVVLVLRTARAGVRRGPAER